MLGDSAEIENSTVALKPLRSDDSQVAVARESVIDVERRFRQLRREHGFNAEKQTDEIPTTDRRTGQNDQAMVEGKRANR